MIEIRIITTKGCEGCRIMKNIANKVATYICFEDSVNVKVTIYDCLDKSIKQFINRYQVNDFPATFILKNNEVVDRIFGTTTKRNMIERIGKLI